MIKLSIFSKLLLCFAFAIVMLVIIVLSLSNSLSSVFVHDINQQVKSSLADSTYQLLLRHSRTTLDYIEDEVSDDMYFSDSDTIQNELSKFIHDPNVNSIIVLDIDNAVLVSSSKPSFSNQKSLYTEVEQKLTKSSEAVFELNNDIIIARKIFIYEEVVGTIILSTNHVYYNSELKKLFGSIQLLSKKHSQFYGSRLTAVILIFTLIFIILIGIVVSRITEPLRQLKLDIKQFGNNSQNSYQFSKHRNDEIGLLARSFYQMAFKVQKREKQISHLAETDTLTQLNNRAFLINKMAGLIASNKYSNLMCIYLDLDNFKDINDTFGHEEGDRLIKEVAKRLYNLTLLDYKDKMMDSCFKNNLFISRLGGDEFVLLFQFDQQTKYSDQLSHALAKCVLNAFEGRLLHYNTSASFGISLYPQNGKSVEDLLKTADIAMYHAKSMGRNQYQFFSQEMSTALIRARDIENALQDVLENNLVDQLYTVYQPQYHLNNKKLVGAEALIRWQHPKYGALSPVEFIQIAERRGLITQLTLLTFDLLLDDMLILKSHCEKKFIISWNLSSVVLLKSNIAELLTEKLQEKGLNSNNISIEITETAFISDLELANKNISKLQKKGFAVWLDDFGTGYSSLSILSDVPIDGLKIDRSFVDKIKEVDVTADANIQTENENNNSIIDAFIKLADTLKLGVVAEGIETQYQLDYLSNLNCNYGQGYYLAKPMVLKKLIELKGVSELIK